MPRPAPRFVILRMLPTSLPYTDRATLLAATPAVGSTGYVDSYAGPVEVWQYTASGWALLGAEWDGVTAGQTLADLVTYDGIAGGAWALVGRAYYVWDGSAWVAYYALDPTSLDVSADLTVTTLDL
jgi:hypothetical protein